MTQKAIKGLFKSIFTERRKKKKNWTTICLVNFSNYIAHSKEFYFMKDP